MKKGFQIEIQKNLTDEEREVAEKFANKWVSEVSAKDLSYAKAMRTEGGYCSWYKRGTLGQRIDDGNLYFRRASRTKRIFQIVHKDELKLANGQRETGRSRYTNYVNGIKVVKDETHDRGEIKEINEERSCSCPKCNGQLRVDNKYGDTETEVYCTIGEIRG